MALTGFAYSEIESSFNVGYATTYVWRGQDLGDNLYQYGFDVAGSCECGLDWSAGIWYGSPADDVNTDELNIYGQISKDFGLVNVAVGFIHYDFDAGGDNSEIFGTVGLSYAGIDFGGAFYQVIDGNIGNGSWAELTASYGYEISDKLSAALGFTFGSTVSADGGDNYTSYNLNLGFDYAVSEDITVSPFIAFNSTDNFNVTGVTDFDGVYGGATVTYSF